MDSSGTITSIDQVFNGFGFIGNIVFSLPGIQAVMPNGRNSDGSLKNITINPTSVFTSTTTAGNNVIGMYATGLGNRFNFYTVQTYSEMINKNQNGFYYVENDNMMYSWTGGSGTIYNDFVIVGKTTNVNNKITNLLSKYTFRAVDSNDFTDYVIESQEPTAENGYTWYRLYKSGWVEQGGFIQSSSTGSVGQSVSLPIEMSNSNYLVQKTLSKVINSSQGFDWVWIGDSSSEQINTSTTIYLSIPSATYCNGVTWEAKGISA